MGEKTRQKIFRLEKTNKALPRGTSIKGSVTLGDDCHITPLQPSGSTNGSRIDVIKGLGSCVEELEVLGLMMLALKGTLCRRTRRAFTEGSLVATSRHVNVVINLFLLLKCSIVAGVLQVALRVQDPSRERLHHRRYSHVYFQCCDGWPFLCDPALARALCITNHNPLNGSDDLENQVIDRFGILSHPLAHHAHTTHPCALPRTNALPLIVQRLERRLRGVGKRRHPAIACCGTLMIG